MQSEQSSSWARTAAGTIAFFCTLILVGIGAWYVVHLPYFSIKTVEVKGETEFTDVPTLQHSLLGVLDGNYFTADLDKMRRLAVAMPWVDEARVERVWPNGISVTIVRHRAVAFWGKKCFISDTGDIFEPKNMKIPEAEGLPSFSGPDDMGPEVVEMYGKLLGDAKKIDANIVSLDVSARGAWSLQMMGNEIPLTVVELGRPTVDSSVESRFRLVVRRYRDMTRMVGGSPKKIDARYVNAFAVTLPPKQDREAGKADSSSDQPSDSRSAINSQKTKKTPSV